MKKLTGVHNRTEAIVKLEGVEKEYSNTRESQHDGITIVHQELNMMDDLTAYENVFIGREDTNKGIIDDRKLVDKTEELFDKLNVNIDPNVKVGI